MSDIVTRLRDGCPGCNRMECKAADEIEGLRAEIARLREERLTNEERSAIAWAAAGLLNDADETMSRGLVERSKHSRDAAETLKRLLERQGIGEKK